MVDRLRLVHRGTAASVDGLRFALTSRRPEWRVPAVTSRLVRLDFVLGILDRLPY